MPFSSPSFINRLSKQTGLNTFGLLFYNNIMCIPLVAVTVVATGELPEMLRFEHWARVGFLLCFLASSSMAILLNYTIFLCTAVTSALTTSVTGAPGAQTELRPIPPIHPPTPPPRTPAPTPQAKSRRS